MIFILTKICVHFVIFQSILTRIFRFSVERNFFMCYPTMWEVSQLWENKK
jgi:hypothetical protein